VVMRNLTISDLERLEAAAGEADVAFEMDEDSFRAFYDRTTRALWLYIARMTGDAHLADDLLQESYYRFLRTRGNWESESHRRAYLFRIATNLVRDGRRRARVARVVALEDPDRTPAAEGDIAEATARRADLRKAMQRLRPRDRALLWLAYAQGHPHTEIADTLGVKTASVKLLLFRARRKLAGLLRGTESSAAEGRHRDDR
jgi:RNA polymerase sigma-70 factor (ECF subfamily)